MISPFMLSNQKSQERSHIDHQIGSTSINRIKNDEVKLLRERLAVMQRRAKQKEQELNVLRQHMKICQNNQVMTVNQQDLQFCDQQLMKQHKKEKITTENEINNKSFFKISHELQINIKNLTTTQQQKPFNRNKFQQDKLLIQTLQTKLSGYQKKHAIFQEALNERTQEFEKEIQVLKQKIREQKKINKDLLKKLEQLEWNNTNLIIQLEELEYKNQNLIEPCIDISAIGIQTDNVEIQIDNVEISKHSKLRFTKLQEIKINSFVKQNLTAKNISLIGNKNIFNIKISPNTQSSSHKRRNKLFIFSRQVHQKVFNIKYSNPTKKNPKYNYNLSQDIKAESFNVNLTSQPQEHKNYQNFQSLISKTQYQSLKNLRENITAQFSNQQLPNRKNLTNNSNVREPLSEIYQRNVSKTSFHQNCDIFKGGHNDNDVQNYRKMILKNKNNQNKKYDQIQFISDKHINSTPQFLVTQNPKELPYPFESNQQSQLRSSKIRRNSLSSTSSVQLKTFSHSMSVKDLIAQKCRQKITLK